MKKIVMTMALLLAVITVSVQDAKSGASPQAAPQKKEMVAKKGCCQEGNDCCKASKTCKKDLCKDCCKSATPCKDCCKEAKACCKEAVKAKACEKAKACKEAKACCKEAAKAVKKCDKGKACEKKCEKAQKK